jgi:hypothetical protein
MPAMKFLHDFGGGIRVEVILTDSPPPKGESHVVRTDWYGGKPTLKHSEQYHLWMHEVNQTVVNRWGAKLLYAVQTGPHRWELWQFEPNAEPVLGRVVES